MEYYNCKNNDSDQWIKELIKLQQVQRLIYQQKDFHKLCQDYKFKKPIRKPAKLYKKEIVSSNNKYPWNNVTQKSQKKDVYNFILRQGLAVSKVMQNSDDLAPLWSSLSILNECSTKFLPAEKSFYDNYEQCRFFEENNKEMPKMDIGQEKWVVKLYFFKCNLNIDISVKIVYILHCKSYLIYMLVPFVITFWYNNITMFLLCFKEKKDYFNLSYYLNAFKFVHHSCSLVNWV